MTPYIVNQMFEENKIINFFSFCTDIFAYRLYISASFVENFEYKFNYTSFTKIVNLA